MEHNAAVVTVDPVDEVVHASARAAEVVASGRGLSIVHQPIVELDHGTIVGYEALARFGEVRDTQAVFEGGQLLGLGPELEARVLARALAGSRRLVRGCRLHVNVSPSVLGSRRISAVLAGARLERIVIELTEHVPAHDLAELQRVLVGLRARGALVAVDDVGSGFSGAELLLGLRPDIVKVDPTLVRGLALHEGRAGVVATVVAAAHRVGARVVAEGVEDRTTLEACVRLGVDAAQGYWLARPARGFPRVDPERVAGIVRADRRVLFGTALASALAPARFVPAREPLRGEGIRVGVDPLGRAVWVALGWRGPLRAREVAVREGFEAVQAALSAGAEAVVLVDDERRALGVVIGKVEASRP